MPWDTCEVGLHAPELVWVWPLRALWARAQGWPRAPNKGVLGHVQVQNYFSLHRFFFFLTELFQFSFSTECSWEVHAPGLMLGIRVPGMYMPGMCPPKKCVPGRCTLLGVLTCEAHAC